MTDAPKLLTKGDVRVLWAKYATDPDGMYDELSERGLIADEPVDPLEWQVKKLISEMAPKVNWDGHCYNKLDRENGDALVLAALKRGMELAQPTLTGEMVEAGLMRIGYSWPRFAIDRLHAALTKGTDHA